MKHGIKIAVMFAVSLWAALPVRAACPVGDLNGDCKVDIADFALLVQNWLETAVPDVTGMTQAQAEAALAAASLAVGTITEEYTFPIPAGYVISSEPAAGSSVNPGSAVNLLISNGPVADMVLIPGGSFSMGDASSSYYYEKPVHTVTLDSFAIGRYEVTNQQYCDFLNAAWSQGDQIVVTSRVYKAGNGTTYPYCDTVVSNAYSRISFSGSTFTVVAGKENHPMVLVSWYGAAAYANWRSGQQGVEVCYSNSDFTPDLTKHGYRLATEAEWEYAARGGLAEQQYPWGDDIAASQANYWTSGDPYEVSPSPYTTPVGFYTGALQQKSTFNWPSSVTSYQTTNGINGYGLYDVAGNVSEWCNDWYSDTYYFSSPTDNPPGPASGSYRVSRGGSWGAEAALLRVASHYGAGSPNIRSDYTGFRLVLDFQ